MNIAVEVLTRATLGPSQEVDPSAWLATRGWIAQGRVLTPAAELPPPPWPYPPSHLSVVVDDLPIHLLRGPSTLAHEPDDAEIAAFLSILDHLIDQSEPDILLAHETDRFTAEALHRGRTRGVKTALRLRDRVVHDPRAVATADTILTPSKALADEIRESTGRPCRVLRDFVDASKVRAESSDRNYLTFFAPTSTNGLSVFARIADELGRLRPDIPILVVTSTEEREALDRCGIDLKKHGNIDLMKPPSEPRIAWARARASLMPALDGFSPPTAAIEAILNGLPVVASDRGGLPEILGQSGITLPLPDRITPATNFLPTAEEVNPWVEAIVRLWDDSEYYAEQCRLAVIEARRFAPQVVTREYAEVFRNLRPDAGRHGLPPGRAKAIILVPHLNGIEPDCEVSLQALERLGVRVARRRGCSAIDVARNEMVSDALHDGFESILFIDADISFDPYDALRLLARPELVVSGIYAKKGRRELVSTFADGINEVLFGPDSPGLYPMKYVATGFLRLQSKALRRMIAELNLPLCNLDWGRGCWPFFQPLIVESATGKPHYLGEDWAFSHRLRQIGITPLADASIRLWHHGTYPYGWEDAGEDRQRFRSYQYRS